MYYIYCVFSIIFVIPTVYNSQSEMKLSFVLYSVYWLSICIMYQTHAQFYGDFEMQVIGNSYEGRLQYFLAITH